MAAKMCWAVGKKTDSPLFNASFGSKSGQMTKKFHSSKKGLRNSKTLPTSPFRFILPKSGQMPKIFGILKGSKHSRSFFGEIGSQFPANQD